MCDQDSRSLSRSSEIAAGATSAGVVATGPLIRRAAAQQPSVQPGRGRILFKGGVVITMDPTIGDLAQGDVLIDGACIAAVGPNFGRSRSAPTSFASMYPRGMPLCVTM